jgi:preprotein translocase subunit SecD
MCLFSVAVCAVAGFFQVAAGATDPSGGKAHTQVYFRSVMCFAPAYRNMSGVSTTVTAQSCSSASRATAANVGISSNASPNGYSSNVVPPDDALAEVPSTSPAKDTASATVLLPGFSISPTGGGERYVLGPAEMMSANVARASAAKSPTRQWVVNYTMTKRGAVQWDKVATENFHAFLAIDLDGVVVSAPLIEPAETQFTSFDGRGEISGNLSKAEAIKLARAL